MLTSGTMPRDAVAATSDADITVSDGTCRAPQGSSRSEGRSSPAMSDRVNILGVGATPQDLKRAVATLDRWRAERRQEYVCVVSVHGLVVAQHDPAIRHALNHCGMATEDGMPLVWWSRLAGASLRRAASVAPICSTRCALSACRANSATTSMEPAQRWWNN